MGLLVIMRVSDALTNACVALTSASLPTERTEVYASRNTLSALLTISSPLTVMSVASPSPRPTRYSMARRSGQMGYALRIRTETAKYCTVRGLLAGHLSPQKDCDIDHWEVAM